MSATPAPPGRDPSRPVSVAAANDAIATAAITILTLAGAYSLTRLFVGHAFAGPIVAVALGAHGVAWLCRRQGWPPVLAFVVSLVALVVLVAWTVLPASTTYGLPLANTLHAAARSFHQATVDFHQVSAPAPVTQGFVLASACGVGVLALLADWAAFRMRATLEATVPSFALFIFCAAIGGHSPRTAAVVVEVAAILAFVVIHQATLDQESTAWFANRTRGALRSALTAGAVIGLGALIIALNLGFRLPGATRKALIAWRASDGAGSGTRNTESPLVNLQGELTDRTNAPVFTVVASQPEYWRQTALDNFNGTDWNSLSTYHSIHGALGAGSTPTVGGQSVVQHFTITNLNSPWLPAAYRPVTVSGVKGVTYDPESGSLISNDNSLSGMSYQVTSLVSTGGGEASRLESAPPPPADATDAAYLQLPSVDAQVKALAQQIVTGKASEYDKALAIQDYLRNPALFSYDLTYSYPGPDPLYHFLFVARQGYCQQFAGSFAVLARLVGLPSRLAVGWSWGTQIGGDEYQITDQQAHTWPEVYFTGVGWVPFEPTPGRGIPGADNYTGVPPAESGAPAPSAATPATTTPSVTTAAGGRHTTPTTKPHAASSPATTRHHHPGAALLLWLIAGLAAGGAVAALLLTLRWLRAVANRDRVVNQAAELESAGHPSQDRFARFREQWSAQGLTAAGAFVRRLKAIVLLGWLLPILPWSTRPGPAAPEVVTRAELLLTWSELVDLLSWWGVRRAPAETYRELARRAGAKLRGPLSVEPAAPAALVRLADAGTKAEFGLGSLSQEEVAAAAADLAVVKRALLGSASGAQRLRLAVDPRLSVKQR